jgi:hypothetical protein
VRCLRTGSAVVSRPRCFDRYVLDELSCVVGFQDRQGSSWHWLAFWTLDMRSSKVFMIRISHDVGLIEKS